MNQLRESYGGTSGAEGGFGPCLLGCLLRCVLDGLAVLCAAAAVLPCVTVSRTCHSGRMPANCFASVSMPLKNAVRLFCGSPTRTLYTREACEPLGEALRCAFSPRRVNIAAQRRARQFHLL